MRRRQCCGSQKERAVQCRRHRTNVAWNFLQRLEAVNESGKVAVTMVYVGSQSKQCNAHIFVPSEKCYVLPKDDPLDYIPVPTLLSLI